VEINNNNDMSLNVEDAEKLITYNETDSIESWCTKYCGDKTRI